MKSIKVCEYSRSRSFDYDLILQDQASGERSQDQWSSGFSETTRVCAYWSMCVNWNEYGILFSVPLKRTVNIFCHILNK